MSAVVGVAGPKVVVVGGTVVGGTVVVVVGGTVVVVGGSVAVVGGSVAAVVVSGGAADGAPLEPDVAKAIPPMAISATTIPVTMGSGLRLKGNPCSPHQPCLCWG